MHGSVFQDDASCACKEPDNGADGKPGTVAESADDGADGGADDSADDGLVDKPDGSGSQF